MLFMGMALHKEMLDFPGGAPALAQSVTPAAEAMRILRWPAERLDTLGGYLTFHNVMLFSGFLALYAALQGTRLIRSPEDRHALEQILATGWSRAAFMRDRVLAFVVALTIIVSSIAMGIAWALEVGDAGDLKGSLVTMLSVGLGALVTFALGLLISQLTRTARIAGGITALVVVVLYLLNNALDQGDTLDWLRLFTPFHWVNQSRALVPGYAFNITAACVLISTSLVLILLALWAFVRRDYGSGLWTRRNQVPEDSTQYPHIQRWWLRKIWTASLYEHRVAVLSWMVASAGFAALMMMLQPAAMDVFERFSFYLNMAGGTGATPEILYMTFTTDVLAPIIAAFVIMQSASWLAEQEQGRVDLLLATPISWPRLTGERLAAAGVGVAAIIIGTLGTFVVGCVLLEVEFSLASIGRVAAMCVLFAWSIAGLALLAVSALRRTLVIALLSLYLGAAYFLTWMIPIFAWPTWTERISIFIAFGHPYREWPSTRSILLLLGTGALATGTSIMIARRSPKIA